MRRLLALLALATALVTAPPAVAAPLHVLVTNDDGVGAEGIDTLVRGLEAEPEVRITVVAPSSNQSGTGGRTTPGPVYGYPTQTRGGHPATAVRGTPADSVGYALDVVLPDDLPDVVISGINDGANLGPFANYSGTVGAARAAARRGLPALATSQGTGSPVNFEAGLAATLGWLRANRDALRPGTVDNLNTPTCRFGAAVLGAVAVPEAHAIDWGALLAGTAPVVCRATRHAPRDDVRAFLQGYATLSPTRT